MRKKSEKDKGSEDPSKKKDRNREHNNGKQEGGKTDYLACA